MNIFKDLKVTENVSEQIAIGKEIKNLKDKFGLPNL